MGKTLCDWSKKDIFKNANELAAIVAKPEFVCAKCARSACAKRHLCKGVPLAKMIPLLKD